MESADKRILLGKKLIELDLLRDQLWEEFAKLAGDKANELFRFLQNR
ncbi:hypothetical protein [Peribacillus kribbensis]|nr:hypothetical protein [Peribacillus kribbensis]